MSYFTMRDDKQLLEKRYVNTKECIVVSFDNYQIHSNFDEPNNTFISCDTDDCIIHARLTDYELSEIWVRHPAYHVKDSSEGTLFKFRDLSPEFVIVQEFGVIK